MSLRLVAVAILFLAVGCDANGDSASETTSPVARCTERFLHQAEEVVTADARRYVEVTYCKPFDARGWVYGDGTLRIDAYLQLGSGGTCASGTAGEPARTIPCEDLEQGYGPQMLDCAALHVVRKSEVRAYLERLQRRREVTCDDGTPLGELGAT